MANQHELSGALAFLAHHPTELTLASLGLLNVLMLIANALFYFRNQRRLRRVQARKRRLDAGPVTAAVGTFTRLGAKEPTLSAGRAAE
jgi:hypothetical protein